MPGARVARRPCNPGEKLGAQGDGALVPVGGYPGMQGVPGQPGLGMPPGQGMPAGMEILPDGE
ncbi:MAG: hypothetical protein FJ086_05260 [Deltaproteobacteria bacterium]|nr:hypothetical protein [Deltaproteobacteria bacterium]